MCCDEVIVSATGAIPREAYMSPQISTQIATQRREEIKKFLAADGWQPLATDYDYSRAYQYARKTLGMARKSRAEKLVRRCAMQLRGEHVRSAGRPVERVTISVEEYNALIGANALGYIEYHDSPRYSKASDSQLDEWQESPNKLIRNAARIELANRKLRAWSEKSEYPQ